jgi:hypothetical protein
VVALVTRRRLPALVGERDRFAAAALAVDRLAARLRKLNPGWHHYTGSDARLVSVEPTT